MRAFNRAFAIVIALLWIAAFAVAIYLMWTPDKNLHIDRTRLQFLFDIAVSGSDRVLGTILAAAAMLPALLLMIFEVWPRRRPERVQREPVPGAGDRYRDLDQRIGDLQRRMDERGGDPGRAVSPGDPVTVSEGRQSEPAGRRWSILNRERR